MPGYAVLDLETTGFSASGSDRIVEIAVVNLDPTGSHQETWTTLVNPRRDAGPTHVHGISATDLRRAPTFDDLAGDVVARLEGRVIVAHNSAFDVRFLQAEFSRSSVPVPELEDVSTCTMRLADQFLPGVHNTLEACCARAGIALANAHEAGADAAATALLFHHYMDRVGLTGTDPDTAWRHPSPWSSQRDAADAAAWPHVERAGVLPLTRGATPSPELDVWQRIAPVAGRTARIDAGPYLDSLVRVLIDRRIWGRESDELVRVAHECGMGPVEVMHANSRYLIALAQAAVSDGVVTKDELTDLQDVARLLGLPDSAPYEALEVVAAHSQAAGTRPTSSAGFHEFRLAPGDIVVFTGKTSVPREEWTKRALRAGLQIGAAVTKSTRVVVAADPDTLSGKAQKADQYSIPVVSEVSFSELLRRMRRR